MPTSAPGSKRQRQRQPVRRAPSAAARGHGFTLLELMIVVAIIALASAISSLALRDANATRLDREALRLATLLDAARAQSRALGVPVLWRPLTAADGALRVGADGRPRDFIFDGLPAGTDLPTRWLGGADQAPVQVDLPLPLRQLVLGPEPVIGAQRLVLRLQDQAVILATDGLGPFVIASP